MTTFDLVVVRTGREAVVRVRGDVDLSTAPRLRQELVALGDDGVLEVTVDLADIGFIDSSGLLALVAGLRRLREQGGDLGLRSPSASTRRVLEITGLTSLLRPEAIEGAGSVDAFSEPDGHCVDWQLTSKPLVGRPSSSAEPGSLL